MATLAAFVPDRDLLRTIDRDPIQLSEKQRHFLNTLRLCGRQCRARSRADLFEACALLSGDKTVAVTTYAETLMRCLSQALGALPVVYAPDVPSVSFDEAWLLQLADAIASEDKSSVDFLLRSRVHPHARRQTGYLMASIVKRSDLI